MHVLASYFHCFSCATATIGLRGNDDHSIEVYQWQQACAEPSRSEGHLFAFCQSQESSNNGSQTFGIINGFIYMENYKLTVEMDDQRHHFEVHEYAHHNGETCKLRVFKNGEFVAAFQPDSHHLLHLCQNPAGLEERMLHVIADHLEAHFPFGGKHYQV